jgi:hypothetical protein
LGLGFLLIRPPFLKAADNCQQLFIIDLLVTLSGRVLLEKKAIGCRIPSSSYWDRTPADTKSDASVSMILSRV